MISQTPILKDTLWRRVAAQAAAWYPPPSYEEKSLQFNSVVWLIFCIFGSLRSIRL